MAQRQWTIEARADCSDSEKEAIKNLVLQHCYELLTSLHMLPTKVKVEVRAYSDDFFAGHEEFNLFGEMAKQKKAAVVDMTEQSGEDTGPSAELIQAALDTQHAKNAKKR